MDERAAAGTGAQMEKIIQCAGHATLFLIRVDEGETFMDVYLQNFQLQLAAICLASSVRAR